MNWWRGGMNAEQSNAYQGRCSTRPIPGPRRRGLRPIAEFGAAESHPSVLACRLPSYVLEHPARRQRFFAVLAAEHGFLVAVLQIGLGRHLLGRRAARPEGIG